MVEKGWVGEVVAVEVEVDVEGERWRVVAEPDLDLLGIEAIAEQDGGAGVAERMRAGPGNAGFAGGGLEHAPVEVAVVERGAGPGREDGSLPP